MDILTVVKSVVAVAGAGSMIAMSFMGMTPSGYFIAFVSICLTWLFGEGIVKNTFNYIRNNSYGRSRAEKEDEIK
jgi:hypothetical protein